MCSNIAGIVFLAFLFSLSLFCSVHLSDAAPPAAVLYSTTMNFFLFWFLHHADAIFSLPIHGAWTEKGNDGAKYRVSGRK